MQPGDYTPEHYSEKKRLRVLLTEISENIIMTNETGHEQIQEQITKFKDLVEEKEFNNREIIAIRKLEEYWENKFRSQRNHIEIEKLLSTMHYLSEILEQK